MLYGLAVVAGILIGLIAEGFARRQVLRPPRVSHESCDQRYEALLTRHQQLRRDYARDVNTREQEIQRLVRGAS